MIPSEFKDADGYKLRFSEKSSEADKKFFRQKYAKVDAVAVEKLHCTTCDMHIGTAPISEKIVRTHMILSVTQCNKCFAFYVSRGFPKNLRSFNFFSSTLELWRVWKRRGRI